jgi:DNA-binding NarL/FixJ family response regulator
MSNSSNLLRVVLIDENRLRGAGIASLISSWALKHELEIRQIRTADVLKAFEHGLTCRLVLYSVGGASIRAVEASGVVRILHALAPQAKVIVISDREDPEDIVSAYRMSCRGFIPTNMEPALALQAISFILDGGTYFPPSALGPMALGGSPGADNGAGGEDDRFPHCGSGDTPVADNGYDSAPTSAEPMNKAAGTPAPRKESEDLSNLTGRQYQVLQCLQKGQPNKLIARELGMTEGTVKVHVRQIMRRLGATNRTQVAILATRSSRATHVPGGRVGGSEEPGVGEISPGWPAHPYGAIGPAAGADAEISAGGRGQSAKSHINGH